MDTREIPTISREQFAVLEGIAPLSRRPVFDTRSNDRDALAAFLEDYKKSLDADKSDVPGAADFSQLINLLKK